MAVTSAAVAIKTKVVHCLDRTVNFVHHLLGTDTCIKENKIKFLCT